MRLVLPFLPWSVVFLLVAACSPTFNWRELRDDAIELKAVMPCKPDRGTREVPLGEGPHQLHMHSCEAGGLTFAVAWVRLPDATQAAAVLEPWRRATLATLQAGGARMDEPDLAWTVRVSGAEGVLGLKARGNSTAGQTMEARAVYFSRGVTVYQAAIYGARIPDEVASSFFDPLRLP
jgi:hypothetical protein